MTAVFIASLHTDNWWHSIIGHKAMPPCTGHFHLETETLQHPAVIFLLSTNDCLKLEKPKPISLIFFPTNFQLRFSINTFFKCSCMSPEFRFQLPTLTTSSPSVIHIKTSGASAATPSTNIFVVQYSWISHLLLIVRLCLSLSVREAWSLVLTILPINYAKKKNHTKCLQLLTSKASQIFKITTANVLFWQTVKEDVQLEA